MKLRNVIKNQNGFSLMEVIAAATIGMVVIYGMASSMTALMSAQKGVTDSAAAGMLISDIRMNLDNEDSCVNMLKNSNFDRSSEQPLTGVQLMISGVSKTVDVSSPDDIVPGVRITGLSILPNAMVPFKDVSMSLGGGPAQPLRRHVATIKVSMEKSTNSAGGQGLAPVFIPLQIYTNQVAGAQLIKGCNSAPTTASLCNEMTNRVWTGSACIPADQCISGGNFAQAPGTAGGFVNPLTNDYTCPSGGFVARRSGSLAASVSCGKECTTTTYYPTYECSKCYTNGGGVTLNGQVASPGGSTTTGYDLGSLIDEGENDLDSNAQRIDDLYATVGATAIPTPVPTVAPTPIATPGGSCRAVSWKCCETEMDASGCPVCTKMGGGAYCD